MLKKETINLLDYSSLDFKNLFSICIGKTTLFQDRFVDYLGIYNSWNTDIENGVLVLDDRKFDVEYIGTTSKKDNMWYSSELERAIPDSYVNLMITIRKTMENLNFEKFTQGKISLEGDINGYNLSMIYIAFANENVAYFCGSGEPAIYMFVKNLPADIFNKMNSIEFSKIITEIIANFNVNHKLMIEALLIENDIKYDNNGDNIVATFDNNSKVTVKFENNNIKSISSN